MPSSTNPSSAGLSSSLGLSNVGAPSSPVASTSKLPSNGNSNGAMNGNSPDEKSALLQILGGITEMQKEISRLHERINDIEVSRSRGNSPQPSPAIRPATIARTASFRSVRGEMERSSSPEKGHPPAHVAQLSRGTSYNNGRPGSAGGLEVSASAAASASSLGLWCVVPAGGAGTRLWPLSREHYPKFLLDLTGTGRTLLQGTWDRLVPLAGPRRMIIVTGKTHVNGVIDQLPDIDDLNVFAEPSPKESMAAIGLAAAVLLKRDPQAVLGSFAADHIISGTDAFESAVTEAVAVAKAGYLVTIGIAPSHPSTGFGYIKLGERLDKVSNAPNARRVTEFKEKPDARTASKYLSTGDYRWNGGMFVVQAKTLLSLLRESMPDLHDGLMKIADAWDTPRREAVMSETWETLPKIAIDHAVAEPAAKAGRVAVIPATFGWDDVGDFASLADLIPSESGEARVLGDSRLVITESQTGGLIVPAAGRTIACLGLDDAVIIDTPDALLVTSRARAQDVKKINVKCKKAFPNLG